MALTDTAARKAVRKDKDYKLSDEKGLHLLVKKNGSKYWQFKYRFLKKEKLLSLGVYPEVSLKQARLGRDTARTQLSQGVDPCQFKQLTKSALYESHANNFKTVALNWFEKNKSGMSERTLQKRLWLLQDKLFPWIGSLPVKDVKPPQILAAVRKIEDKGTIDTASRAKQVASQVFRFAVAEGICDFDPTRDLKGALTSAKINHRAALMGSEKLAGLLKDIDAYKGSFKVVCLMKMSAYLFQRPGEMRKMEWSEINFEKKIWELPAAKMKMGVEHIVPLSTQVMQLLHELQPHAISNNPYVFPGQGQRGSPSSDATVIRALRRMGYSSDQMCAHGFRAVARTQMDEELGIRIDLIEHQLSHAVFDPLGRAYNRTTFLKERKMMMQQWADYLDKLRLG